MPRTSGHKKSHKLKKPVKRTPSLLYFPNELLIVIADNLEDPKDVGSLLQTNHRLAALLTPQFYGLALELGRLKFYPFVRETILHWAAKRGYERLIKQLLATGIDIMALDYFGSTALHRASQKGHAGVVRLLIQVEGVDKANDTIDSSGYNALHWAALNGCKEVISVLLQEGIDSTVVTTSGGTAIQLADRMGHSMVVTLLSK